MIKSAAVSFLVMLCLALTRDAGQARMDARRL